MKRLFTLAFSALLLAGTALFAFAAGEVSVRVQDGYTCDYGINLPFTPSPRAKDYTFTVFPGEEALGPPEMRAEVTLPSQQPATIYLPLRYDPAGPSKHTLEVTAHAMPGREGLDGEAFLISTFTTAPTCGCPAGTAGAYYVGDGSAQRPFQVSAQEQLLHIEKHPSANLLQVNDIACNKTVSPAGTFSGSYDGGWHRISGLNKPLFSTLRQASVQRLGIEDSTAIFSTSSDVIGALASTVYDGTLRDCYVLNCSLRGYSTGGLVGGFYGEASTVERCYALGVRVDSHSSPAGLIGRADEARFQMFHCYAIPAALSTESAGYPPGALFGSTAYSGHTASIVQSYWCTSVVSNGAGGDYVDAHLSIDSYSKGFPLSGFSSLGNFTGFDETNWTIRSMTLDTAGGSVTTGVPVLRRFYE